MYWLGGVMLFIGIILFVFGVSLALDVGQPGQTVTYSTAFCSFGLGLPFLIAGGIIIYTTLQSQRRQRQEEIEAKVLQIAISKGGRITAAEVAMTTDLSLAEAQAYLEGLARNGTIRMEVGVRGTMVYCFSDTHH